MDEEELNVLRTKLLLCGSRVISVGSTGPTWAITRLDKPNYFTFKPPHNNFFVAEEDALKNGLALHMKGAERYDDY